MASNCRFAFAVHILAVLGSSAKTGGVCSDRLAGSVNTNPVVVRRLLSQLRRAGLVITHKGAHGGASLGAPARQISLDRIYRAVESPASLRGHHQKPNPKCPVGAGIEKVLGEVFASAQAALEEALAQRTLRDVLDAMAEESEAQSAHQVSLEDRGR